MSDGRSEEGPVGDPAGRETGSYPSGGSGDPGGASDRVRVAAGVALFAAGAVAVLVPGPFPDRFPVLVWLVGLGALVLGVRAARRVERPDPVRTPDVEALSRVPVPGSTFDRTLAAFLEEGQEHLLYPRRVRAALSNAAVEVLSRYRGLTPSTARERIDGGEWTDDAVAAAFLAGGESVPDPDGSRIPGASWLRRRGSAFDRGVRHAVAAVARVAGAEVGPPSSLGSPEQGTGREPTPATLAGWGEPRAEGERGDAAREGGRSTRRWAGLGAATFLAVGAGVLAGWSGAVLAGAVALGYAASAGAVRAPSPDLAVEREVSATDPDPGDRVEVTAVVTNEGDRTVPDLRVVDGVPGGLAVVEGSPRWAGPLRPGESVTLEYAVAARRGRHRFDAPLAVARDALGARERTVRTDADATTVTCVPPLVATGSVPLRAGTARYAGETPTDDGGEGVEFHATREYRRGDPLTRIDWNRLARRGELASREFRRERATTTVVAVDARPAAYLAPGPDRPHAVDRAVAAARRVVATLERAGNRVGVAAVGRAECWLPPGNGADHRARARRLLATHPALSSVPPRDGTAGRAPDGGTDRGTAGEGGSTAGIGPPGTAEEGDLTGAERRHLRRLRTRLPAGAQVVLCSPVADPGAVRIARALEARGHPVTVLSPDPTAADAPTRALARVGRVLRLAELRDGGPAVVDWPADRPLAVALARARR